MITCNDLRSHIVALPPLRCHLPLLDAWHSSLRKQGVRRESASGYLMSELTEEGEQGRVLFWKGGTCATCMRHQTVKIFSGVVAMQVAQVPPFQKNTSSLAFFGWFWHQVSWCRCSPHPALRKSSMRAPTGRPHALPWASWSFGMRQKSWPLRNACTDIEVMLNATFEKDLGLPSRLPLSWTPWTHAWQTSLSVRNQDACDACRWTVLEMGTTLTDIWREDKQFSFRSQAEGWICWSLTLCLAIVANLTKSWPGWRPPMIRTSKLSLDSIEQWTGDLTDTWVVHLFGADNEFSTLRVANISSMQQWPGGLSDTCILRFFALAKEWRVWMEGPSWKLLDISCVGRI